jgi:hypothetical protein
VYGVEATFRRIYTLTDALCTPVGSQPFNSAWTNLFSLAYDPTRDVIFGVDQQDKQLISFNRTTGQGTAVGTGTLVGYPQIRSLAYRAANDRLYAVDQTTKMLLSIHPTTGVATPVVTTTPLPNWRIEDLQFVGDVLYGSYGEFITGGVLITGQLVTVNLASGVLTNVGPQILDVSPHVCLVNSIPETVAWSKLSGPGTATFGSPTSADTTVSFSAPGVYVLELTVSLAAGGAVSDTVTVTSDGCPGDPNKVVAGVCGCGVADFDSDGDGTLDCNDGCPSDPNKLAPGTCGCGVADVDSDGDGALDCNDGCPSDPNKLAPGTCGCGVADVDSDGDGTLDCNDGCPLDPSKTSPGACGCGVEDLDDDGDGTANCVDGCPSDPGKTAPGACGCGVADTDDDGDGTANCIDGCPGDPGKIAPGVCGCGVSDADTDGDATPDCVDGCPNDANKIDPGTCGCGVADVDTDGDGFADCVDNCAAVSNASQLDGDGDGVGDDCDNCPLHANSAQADCDGDTFGDVCEIADGTSTDLNFNGVPDDCETSPGTGYCFGDGTATACPCSNPSQPGAGCANSSGVGSILANTGGASCAADDAVMLVTQLPLNKSGILYMGTDWKNGGLGSAIGAGLRCVGGQLKRFSVHNSGATGSFQQGNVVANSGGLITPGSTWYFQVWHRDAPLACGEQINFSNGYKVTFAP